MLRVRAPEPAVGPSAAGGPNLEGIRRVARRLRAHGLGAHLRGLLVRLRVQQAGILVIPDVWPLPTIRNDGGQIILGNCSLFASVRLECWEGAVIQIGDGTYLNRNTELVAGRAITIGRDCKIARDVIIMDTDQHPIRNEPLAMRPVCIGDRVWIGARAIILKGVTVGDDAIIGAGSVVTRDVPPRGVVAGVPARVLRQD